MSGKRNLSEMSGDDFVAHWISCHKAEWTFAAFLVGFNTEDIHIKATTRAGAKSKDPNFYLRRDVKNLLKMVRKNLKGVGFNLPKLAGESARAKTTRTMSEGADLKAMALQWNLPKYTAAEKKEDKAAMDRALTAQAGKGKKAKDRALITVRGTAQAGKGK